jgi:hypothetical protein
VALSCDDDPENIEHRRLPSGLMLGDDCYLDAAVDDLRSQLAVKDDEIAMLRLELDVNRTDDGRRADRITEIEQRVARHEATLGEYLGSIETVCRYLADTVARLRAMS